MTSEHPIPFSAPSTSAHPDETNNVTEPYSADFMPFEKFIETDGDISSYIDCFKDMEFDPNFLDYLSDNDEWNEDEEEEAQEEEREGKSGSVSPVNVPQDSLVNKPNKNNNAKKMPKRTTALKKKGGAKAENPEWKPNMEVQDFLDLTQPAMNNVIKSSAKSLNKGACDIGGARKQKVNSVLPNVVDVNGMLYSKPAMSYATLIAYALLNSFSGELTVSEIYAFMSENFPFFQVAPLGWKSSVRHNLSLNKCFYKHEMESSVHTRTSCRWSFDPTKKDKTVAELKSSKRRHFLEIATSVARQEDIEALLTGTLGVPTEAMNFRGARLNLSKEHCAQDLMSQYSDVLSQRSSNVADILRPSKRIRRRKLPSDSFEYAEVKRQAPKMVYRGPVRATIPLNQCMGQPKQGPIILRNPIHLVPLRPSEASRAASPNAPLSQPLGYQHQHQPQYSTLAQLLRDDSTNSAPLRPAPPPVPELQEPVRAKTPASFENAGAEPSSSGTESSSALEALLKQNNCKPNILRRSKSSQPNQFVRNQMTPLKALDDILPPSNAAIKRCLFTEPRSHSTAAASVVREPLSLVQPPLARNDNARNPTLSMLTMSAVDENDPYLASDESIFDFLTAHNTLFDDSFNRSPFKAPAVSPIVKSPSGHLLHESSFPF